MNKFQVGKVLATPDALEAIQESGQSPAFFLDKHAMGDWGEVNADDKRANDDALISGERLLSAFKTLKGRKIWVLTEAEDDEGNRAATTICLPSEY